MSEDMDKFEKEVLGEDDLDTDNSLKSPKYEIKAGEVWKLGEHRLMCGDAIKEEDVNKLMSGEKADMVFTDPPYGLGYEYNSHEDVPGDKYEKFCDTWFQILSKLCDKIIITTGWKYNLFWTKKEPFDNMYWVMRGKHSGGRISHFRLVEPIFAFGKKFNKYDFDLFETTKEIRYMGETNLRELHTCPKPLKLIKEIINPQTKQNDNILDVFGGSGTTLIACEQLDRKCFMMEIDPVYCSVIIERWENVTGLKATKVN